MTKEELLTKLAYFQDSNNTIGAALYFVLTEEENTVIRFADIENEAKIELKDRFLEYINEKFIDNTELHFQNISEADDRKNVVYKYDIDEKPESLNILDEILTNEEQEPFTFAENSLQNIQGYLITIGNENNKIALYKKHHPVNLLQRGRFLLVPSGQRLVKVNDDAIALDKSFDFMLLDSQLVVLRLNTLERFFGFDDVIRKQAQSTIQAIDENAFLEDIEQLIGFAEDNLAHARKLMKIKNSPVLTLPVKSIIKFIQGHPELKGRIHFNEGKTKLNLKTDVSKKLFLKLLNDDYLISQLTELQYDSHAKDKLEKAKKTKSSGDKK